MEKKLAAACVSALFMLAGCGGVEPEKRMYPLALGADITEGRYQLTYGIPDLPKSTGQEKDGEDQGNAAPSIQGETFREIENIYSRTQENIWIWDIWKFWFGREFVRWRALGAGS